jgi:hypothetical protein
MTKSRWMDALLSVELAAIGLRIRRLHANRHSQNAHACETGQRALHKGDPSGE